MTPEDTSNEAGGHSSRRRNLGRGLSALFGEEADDYAELDRVRQTKTAPVELLIPGKFQPRHAFADDQLAELVESVREKGVLQPILVRRHPDSANQYEIIAGERRWRAAQRAQLHEVPIIVKELSNQDALEIALIENIQRQDLTALEEAEGFQRLMDEFSHTQEGLAQTVGKSRSHVANMLRLLSLPDPVKGMIQAGELSAGHARALINATEPEQLAQYVKAKGLNVRQTERLAQKSKAEPTAKPEKDADTLALERDLSSLLGLRVKINYRGDKGGDLTISYRTLEQLDDVLQRLSAKPNQEF